MRIFDITLTLSPELPVWPGDPPLILERIARIESGDEVNLTRLSMSVHSGTHIDAPFHFLGGNSLTVEKISLDDLTGRAYVLQIANSVVLVTREILSQANIPARTRRLLLKTANSIRWENGTQHFYPGFCALSPEAAAYLVERGIRLVGVDYLSVAPFEGGAPTHQILLKAGVVVVEGLNLSKVPPGRYTLYCLPLKLLGADGAPARAILIRN